MKGMIIVLIGIIILSVVAGFYIDRQIKKNVELNINGLEIKAGQFGDIVNTISEGKFIICDIEKDKCFLLNKQELE